MPSSMYGRLIVLPPVVLTHWGAAVTTITGNHFLEDTREFAEMITNTGAKCRKTSDFQYYNGPIFGCDNTTKLVVFKGMQFLGLQLEEIGCLQRSFV